MGVCLCVWLWVVGAEGVGVDVGRWVSEWLLGERSVTVFMVVLLI